MMHLMLRTPIPVNRSDVWGMVPYPTLPCDLFHDAFDATYSLPREQADVCENIIFPQLRLRSAKNKVIFLHNYVHQLLHEEDPV